MEEIDDDIYEGINAPHIQKESEKMNELYKRIEKLEKCVGKKLCDNCKDKYKCLTT